MGGGESCKEFLSFSSSKQKKNKCPFVNVLYLFELCSYDCFANRSHDVRLSDAKSSVSRCTLTAIPTPWKHSKTYHFIISGAKVERTSGRTAKENLTSGHARYYLRVVRSMRMAFERCRQIWKHIIEGRCNVIERIHQNFRA